MGAANHTSPALSVYRLMHHINPMQIPKRLHLPPLPLHVHIVPANTGSHRQVLLTPALPALTLHQHPAFLESCMAMNNVSAHPSSCHLPGTAPPHGVLKVL
ncbi:hypothetical protein GDO81_030120 [Engystomops pustulosus]|uniref:Uncharacterized protein n=1 Tax=Engystomops pustulosus TaxID=76066 RepID=A0AAV6ZL16_ENGPU|nr:hypothetical protein GDO81_030120 [Engystomops pustulosus]